MFMGSGELKYIDLYYQTIGNALLSEATRRDLGNEFKCVRTEYREWLTKNTPGPDVRMADVNFSYFDNIADEYRERKNELKHHPMRNTT